MKRGQKVHLKIGSRQNGAAKNQYSLTSKIRYIMLNLVAKRGLMITHLGGTRQHLTLKGLEFRGPDFPALNLLPEGDNSIPQMVNIRITI